MDFDLGWILLGLPLAFVFGWLASRFDIRQLRLENRQNPKAYFKGLNHLLNEQQDQAIDAFIQAVQQDPDTSELHFALGSLFRRRGEFDRAVRVHQHLLARSDLSRQEHERAQSALAYDFLKAGLLDRAEEGFAKLKHTAHNQEAQLALLSIFEKTRDWQKAFDTTREIEPQELGDFKTRQAHYLCELAAAALTQTPAQLSLAENLLQQAQLIAPQHARAYLASADLAHAQGQLAQAYQTLMELAERTPTCLPLLCERLLSWGRSLGKVKEIHALFLASYSAHPCLDVLKAVASLEGTSERAQNLLSQHLRLHPSLLVASWWLGHEQLQHEEDRAFVQKALDRATVALNRYRCAACGFEAQKHFWHCPGCQAWDSYPSLRIEEL
jgi:lipopolysaccharide biosynthesis regulator YciM